MRTAQCEKWLEEVNSHLEEAIRTLESVCIVDPPMAEEYTKIQGTIEIIRRELDRMG